MSGRAPAAQGRLDVAIVGCGPVGLVAAIQLGRLGHRVGVFERWPAPYPRPRAVHYDDEIARVLQHLGLARQLAPITEPATTYEWRNAAGQTLLLLDRRAPGPSGWPAATMFTQPDLERLLEARAAQEPSVEVHRGWEVADVLDRGADVLLRARRGEVSDGDWQATGEEMQVLADYAVGCDGANSIVRERMGTELHDLGFVFDWLIADTVPHDPSLLAGVNLQVCDPARPTTLVSGGPGRRRWEWMLLPGETRQQVQRADFVWELLARSGVGREQVTLERNAVYTFRARWAQSWREGRLLLAGDAAHLMPPFAGQGMCSGIRDAWTLAWHLDLVLRGLAPADSLDAYTSERLGHLQHAISVSVELGKVICIADQQEAAARDRTLLALADDPDAPAFEPPAPSLGPGILDAQDAAAGTLFPQGEVCIDGRSLLLEDAIGEGFVLYLLADEPAAAADLATAPGDPATPGDRAAPDEPAAAVAPAAAAFLESLGAQTVELTPAVDRAGVYRGWFERHGCVAALVRPDFYVFGTAARASEVSGLVWRLRSALTRPLPSSG